MLKRVVVAAMAAGVLSGCEEPPPDPAVMAMIQQCQAGDQAACANYAQMRQTQAQMGAAIMQNWQGGDAQLGYVLPTSNAPPPYVGAVRPVTCYPAYGGGVACY